MTKKIKSTVGVCAAILLMSSCSVTAPLAATSNPIGKKIGTAKASSVFGICFNGDYSIQTAAKNGGITKVGTVDVKHVNVLGVFNSHKTIVTGE